MFSVSAGWCSNDAKDTALTLTFPQSYGVKGVVVTAPIVSSGSYPTKVQVQYVPNGGNDFIDFNFESGPLVNDESI